MGHRFSQAKTFALKNKFFCQKVWLFQIFFVPLQPISPYGMKNAKDIESHLSYSEKITGIVAGHQQETKQLLENIEELQDDVRHLLDENNDLRAANATKEARIAELEARVAQLEARPNIIADNYFERCTANQVITLQQRGSKRNKVKQRDDTNQLFLELWKDNQTAIL